MSKSSIMSMSVIMITTYVYNCTSGLSRSNPKWLVTSGESDITYNLYIYSNDSESQVCTHGRNRCNEIVQRLNSMRRCRTMETKCRLMHIMASKV